jgi:Ni/Fe-hydrogenase 1 B-type cytochrome subunit
MSKLSFREWHSLGIRIWHWANGAVVAALLWTVFLRKYLLSPRDNNPLIQAKLAEMGFTATPAQAKTVAHIYVDHLWEWHVRLGLILAGLFALRIIVEIFTSTQARLHHKILSGVRYMKLLPQARAEGRHYIAVKITYVAFYIILATMVLTGLAMNYGETLKLGETLDHYIGEIHEYVMYGVLVFVIGHIIGVIVSENTKAPGIVSDMINGGPQQK